MVKHIKYPRGALQCPRIANLSLLSLKLKKYIFYTRKIFIAIYPSLHLICLQIYFQYLYLYLHIYIKTSWQPLILGDLGAWTARGGLKSSPPKGGLTSGGCIFNQEVNQWWYILNSMNFVFGQPKGELKSSSSKEG